jgi:5'-methylthioadenosine phosphorylase
LRLDGDSALSARSSRQKAPSAQVGILGGSGLYTLAGLTQTRNAPVRTPFGRPSAVPVVGRLAGVRVAFLARHGRRHELLPSAINYQANIFALKRLGVERILSVSAVGSLREAIEPGQLALPEQFVDQSQRRGTTFFGAGVAAHVALADPVCLETHAHLCAAAGRCGVAAHERATYLCIEGPAFSTRAESRLYRAWGADVIGMTNATEARLAREAEICYAVLALVTDYDSWREQDDVRVTAVLEQLRTAGTLAAAVVREVLPELARSPRACACSSALAHALLTPPAAIPPAARRRLRPILGKYLK